MTNTMKLKGAIAENGLSIARLSKKIDVSTGALSAKVNGKRTFTQEEIKKITAALQLTPEQRDMIFFDG